jgi:hypothetical protein
VGGITEGPWAKAGSIAGIVGTVVAILALLGFGFHVFSSQPSPKPSTISPLIREQYMVSLLKPPDDYNKMKQIIGTLPNIHDRLKSGRTLYQFDRPWEHIDLLVEHGTVLSVGIYAKVSNFKPILDERGKSLVLNGPPISHQIADSTPLGAWGECGGSSGGVYFQGYSLPHTYDFGYFLLGWEMPGSLMPDAACRVVSPFHQCYKEIAAGLVLSGKLLDCVIDSKEGPSI